jgi:hypothetical protein
MNICILLLALIFSILAKHSNEPILWFNFKNNGVLSTIEDKSRVNQRIYLESINNKEHFISSDHVHLRNNYLRSVNSIQKIKTNILKTNELSIKVSLKSSQIYTDIFCLFCIMHDQELLGKLDTVIKDCSNINFGIIIIKNILMVINRDVRSIDCRDSSVQVVVPFEKKQVFLFQMNNKYKRVYMNDKLLLEDAPINGIPDISNWNDDYKIFIGKNIKKNSNAYINVVDIILWSEIVPFNIIHSFNPKEEKIAKLAEIQPQNNEMTNYYENSENNNYLLSKWITSDKSLFVDPTKAEDIYVKKSGCFVDYMDNSEYRVRTYYNKDTMDVRLRLEHNSKELDSDAYTSKSTETYELNKKDNIRFNKIDYVIRLNEPLTLNEPILFNIVLLAKGTNRKLYNYPCTIYTNTMVEKGNKVTASVVDSVRLLNTRVKVTDFFIKNDDLHIDFTTTFENHFNRDITLEEKTIVESNGFPMKIKLLNKEKEIQKWRLTTKKHAFKNFDENQYASTNVIYFKLKDIGIVVKTQVTFISDDFSVIKRARNLYGAANTKYNKKKNKKSEMVIVETFYSEPSLTKQMEVLYYSKPIYMTVSVMDAATNTSVLACNDKNVLLQIKKITIEVEKSNGIHHYDITNLIHHHTHELYKDRKICLSTIILSFQLEKYHLDGSLPNKQPFFKIEWKFIDDITMIGLLPKKHDSEFLNKMFDGNERNYFHRTRTIDVRCCPLWECGLSSGRCVWTDNKEIIVGAFLGAIVLVVFFFFVLYLKNKMFGKLADKHKEEDYALNNESVLIDVDQSMYSNHNYNKAF